MSTPLYKEIASTINALKNLRSRTLVNKEWEDRWESRLEQIQNALLPSGSGIDSGTTISFEESSEDKIVLLTSFHHMNEHGYYDGWTDHKVTVRASLQFDIDIKIGGRDRNQIKDYLHDVFHECLTQKVDLRFTYKE